MLSKLFGGNTARTAEKITELDKLRLEAEMDWIKHREEMRQMAAQRMQRSIDRSIFDSILDARNPILEMERLADFTILRNKTTGELCLKYNGETNAMSGLNELLSEMRQLTYQTLMDETK